MEDQVILMVDVEFKGLGEIYVCGGLWDLVEIIDWWVCWFDVSFYFLVDFVGNVFVGNIVGLLMIVFDEVDGGLQKVYYICNVWCQVQM